MPSKKAPSKTKSTKPKTSPKAKTKPSSIEARLLEDAVHGPYRALARVLRELAKHPLPTVAVAVLDRLLHPAFGSQLPGARELQRKSLGELRALGEAQPAIAVALSTRRKDIAAFEASMKPEAASASGGDPVLAQIERLRAVYAAGLDQDAKAKWQSQLDKATKGLFEKWQPYPVWVFDELTPAQRAYHTLRFDSADWWVDLRDPVKRASFARRIGRASAGPADTLLALDRPRPLWCAVSDVAADLREPTEVIAAFRALAPAIGLAAWNELARGVHAVNAERAKEWKFASSGGVRAWNVGYRDRFVELMADLSLALGAAGEKAAIELAREQGKRGVASRITDVAVYSLARHAAARGQPLDPTWDPLLRTMFPASENPAIHQKLLAMLPAERAAPLRAHAYVVR